jgi:hypothetical protein
MRAVDRNGVPCNGSVKDLARQVAFQTMTQSAQTYAGERAAAMVCHHARSDRNTRAVWAGILAGVGIWAGVNLKQEFDVAQAMPAPAPVVAVVKQWGAVAGWGVGTGVAGALGLVAIVGAVRAGREAHQARTRLARVMGGPS